MDYFQIIRASGVVHGQNNMLTPTMKVLRKNMMNTYSKVIDGMYAS